MRGYVRIFRESYNYDILCFIMQYFVCERKRVAFNFEDEFNLCRKDEASLIRNNHLIFSVDRRPRCNNCVHRNTFSFFLYIFLQGLHVSVLVKSLAFLTVLPLSTLYTLLLITFWLFAKGQWSCISNIRFRKARKKGSLIYLLRVIFMFILNINVYFLQKKKKKEKKNEIHSEFYRFVYRGLQRRNTAFSFRSIFYVIYTEIRSANTFLLLQFLRDTQRVALLINPFCLMNII